MNIFLRLSNSPGGIPFLIDTDPYLANDNVGGLGRVYYGHLLGNDLIMRGIALRDTAKKNIAFNFHIYRSPPVEPLPLSDNDPFIPSVAYADLEIGIVTVEAGLYATPPGGNYSKAYKEITHINIGKSDDNAFYVYMECLSAGTYLNEKDLLPEFVFWRS